MIVNTFCFRQKAFLKWDTVVGLTRSVSLKWCKILVWLRNFNYEISVVLNLAPCNFTGCWRGGTLESRTIQERLRRRLSKVLCTIVVSFINVYYEYFCELMWLPAKSPHVLELLNITPQCKIRFLDINVHFIEQNIHVL